MREEEVRKRQKKKIKNHRKVWHGSYKRVFISNVSTHVCSVLSETKKGREGQGEGGN